MFALKTGKESVSLVVRGGDKAYQVMVGERVYTVEVERVVGGRLLLRIDGQSVQAIAVETETEYQVWLDGETYRLPKPDRRSQRRRRTDGAASGALTASMPGQVLAVRVSEGERVAQGATLVILESMKMEQRITAPHAGTVTAVNCRVGETVERGQVLVAVDEAMIR